MSVPRSLLAGLVCFVLVAMAPAIKAHDSASALGPAMDFTVVPGVRFGPIRASTTQDELRLLLGDSSLEPTPVYMGEGFCAAGAKAFVGTSDELEIAWTEPPGRGVALVRASTAGGRWGTANGVRVGLSLTDLEALAGRVLEFAGFGWDYGGRLAWEEPSGALTLYLGVDFRQLEAAGQTMPNDATILGDVRVRSDHPAIRRLPVRVVSITQSWGPVGREVECPPLPEP